MNQHETELASVKVAGSKMIHRYESLFIVLFTIAMTLGIVRMFAHDYVDGRISVLEECKQYKHARVNNVHYTCEFKPIIPDNEKK